MTTTLLRTLLNAGIPASDAQMLEGVFANEPDFMQGLETIARRLGLGEAPGLFTPAGEPWRSIHEVMINSGLGMEDAFNQALGGWPAHVQTAILGAVTRRMTDLQQWLQTSQGQNKKRKTAEYLQALSNLGYDFKYNLCTRNVEVNGAAITDPMMFQIRGKMRDIGIWEVNVFEEAYTAHAWERRYHPIRDYLMGLKFEGSDPIGELAGYFYDERGVIGTWLRRWLIGTVARAMAGEQNRMLVLDGAQGLGKDYFARWLCSPMHEYFYEGPVLPDDKDCRLRMLSCWIWNVNELGSTTRRSDREALKAFLTTQVVRVRQPYARFDIQGPAMSSFLGTVNNEGGVLNDPTGSRRFMVAGLKKIDWAYTKIDVDQVWAQAFDLYLAGETWRLEGDEQTAANEINEQYQVVDLVEETVLKYFEIDPAQAGWWMSTLEILEVLKHPLKGNLKAGIEVDTRRLASALTKFGLEKPSQQKRIRGYVGIRLRTP